MKKTVYILSIILALLLHASSLSFLHAKDFVIDQWNVDQDKELSFSWTAPKDGMCYWHVYGENRRNVPELSVEADGEETKNKNSNKLETILPQSKLQLRVLKGVTYTLSASFNHSGNYISVLDFSPDEITLSLLDKDNKSAPLAVQKQDENELESTLERSEPELPYLNNDNNISYSEYSSSDGTGGNIVGTSYSGTRDARDDSSLFVIISVFSIILVAAIVIIIKIELKRKYNNQNKGNDHSEQTCLYIFTEYSDGTRQKWRIKQPSKGERSIYSIGRDQQCDLKLNDNKVSRLHAYIEYKQGNFYIRDNRSRNGIFEQDKRLNTNTSYLIYSKSSYILGQTRINFTTKNMHS